MEANPGILSPMSPSAGIFSFDTQVQGTKILGSSQDYPCFGASVIYFNLILTRWRLKANDYFEVQSSKINTQTYAANIIKKSNFDNDTIQNADDQTLPETEIHYNFKFQLKACNDPDVTSDGDCSFSAEELEGKTCSDSIFVDSSNLIGEEGKGNSLISFSVKERIFSII